MQAKQEVEFFLFYFNILWIPACTINSYSSQQEIKVAIRSYPLKQNQKLNHKYTSS